MSWLHYLVTTVPGTAPWLMATGGAVSPLSSVAGDITTYILGFGPLGIGVVLYTMRVIVPGKAIDEAREQARADLLEENRRLIAEKAEAERQRDEARRFATDQLVPLLGQFTAATSSLLPVLQELIRDREQGRDREDRRAIERRPRRREPP
jgi:hypothetical protein